VVFSGLPYFVPTASGTYAVVLQFGNGCQDTSSCHQVTLTGLSESANGIPFSLRPNPGDGWFTWGEEIRVEYLEVYDITGRRMEQLHLLNKQHSFDLRALSNGIYFLIAIGSDRSKWYGRVEIQK